MSRHFLALLASLASSSASSILPTSPPSLAVRVDGVTLRFDPPETENFQAQGKEGGLPDAPENHAPEFSRKEIWPGSVRLTPSYDATRTHILGNFFRSFRPDSITVTAEDGRPARRGIDFLVQDDWGVIANKDGRLAGKIDARGESALQRLDLIQMDSAGNSSVKKGESAWVCPKLPEPDAGYSALAGIYIAAWPAARNPHFDSHPEAIADATEYAVTAHEIFPLTGPPPVPTIHPEFLQGVLEKLRSGRTVKIAFMGDSITLGAEATRWWKDHFDENSTTWKGIFIHELRRRFPLATIEVIKAYKGGVTADYGLEKLAEVTAQKPDLVIAAFGTNDADGDIGTPPRNPPELFGRALAAIADETRAAGGDVLFLTPFPVNPWLRNGAAARIENEYIPVLMKTAVAHRAAVADVHAAFRNSNARGIPYWSQYHNWTNHPGLDGHKIYADTVLEGFPP